MAQVKEITTSGGWNGSSSIPANNAGSVAKASASSAGKTSTSSAAGSYSKSGSSTQSSKSISKAASNAKAAIAAGARYASAKNAEASSNARFGSGIGNNAKPASGTFSQQGTPKKVGIYAGGGLNPSAWGSSMVSPSVKRDDSALQKAIDDISLPVDYEDRNIHAIDPDKNADASYLQKAAEFNMGRQIWAYNDTASALTREYASNEEQLADILDLMTHAQVYYNDARKNDYKFNFNGEEVSAADEWKKLYDELERRSGWLTDVGQVQDLFTRYQNGEDVTPENVDTMAARAQARLDNPYNDEDAAMWQGVIGDLNNIWGGVNRKTAQALQGQVDDLGAQLTAAKNAALVAEQSENSLNFADVIVSDADRQMIKEKAEEARATTQGIYDQQMAAQAQLDQLNADYRARFMTPEVEAAMQRLSIAQLGKAYPEAHGKADAERMRQEDQQLVDDWNSGMGFAQQYYNWQDRVAGVSKSFAARTAGSAANIAAWGAGAITYDGERIKAADKLEQIADNLDEKSQAEIAKAKENASKWGQFGLDLLSTAMDMGFDALTGGGLKTMFARVAGSGIGEARRAGASSEQQLAYGLAQGAVEALTEKITDGVGLIYGKGITTDVVEKAISRLSSSDAGANFLRILNGAIGEGGEEVLSDLAQPFINWIIDENARDNRTVDIDLSEMLYDFLLGGAMGLLGQGVEAANGSYAAKNIAQTDAMTERYDALMEELGENPRQVTGAEQAEIKRLEARMGDRENVSTPIGLFGSPLMQQIRRNTQNITTRSKGTNRHDTATGVLAEGFEDAGYVNSTNADEDYNTATTGAETRAPSVSDADENTPVYEEPPENTKGGDAHGYQSEEQTEAQKREQAAKIYAESKASSVKAIDNLLETGEKDKNGNILIDMSPTSRDREFITGERESTGDEGRVIVRDTLEAMKAASRERPIYAVKVGGKGIRKTFRYDGATLTMVTADKSGKPKVVTIPADQLTTQAKYLQGIFSSDATLGGKGAYNVLTEERYNNFNPKAVNRIKTMAERVFNEIGVKFEDLATTTETATGAQATSTQANAQENTQPPVKLEGNERGEAVTSEELKADAKAVVTKIKDAIIKNGVDHHPVIGISSDTFQKKAGEKLTDKVGQFFREIGNKVISKALGGKEVVIDEQGIRSDIAHGLGKAKAATFAAVPKVLEEGRVIDTQYNWKNRGYDTKIIAAPITIDKKTAYVGCVVSMVKENGSARYYLHEVVDGNGDLIYSFDGITSDTGKKSPDVDIQTGIANNGDTSSTSELNVSIAQSTEGGKSSNVPDYYYDPGFQSLYSAVRTFAPYGEDPWDIAVEAWEYGYRSGEEYVAGTPSAAQSTEGGTNASTNVSQDGTIAEKGANESDSIESGSVPEGNAGTVSGAGKNVENGASPRLQEIREDNKEDAATHEDLRTADTPVLKKENVQPEIQSLVEWSEKQTGEECRLHDASGYPNVNAGASYREGEGISVAAIHPRARRTENGIVGGAGTSVVHETVHKKIQQLGTKATEVLNNAYQKIKATDDQINRTYDMVCWAYGRYYAQGQDALTQVTSEQWNDMLPAERKAAIDALPENIREYVNDKIAEETLCFFISRDAQLGKYKGTYTIAEASREAAVEASLFSANAFDNIDSKMQMANLVSLMQAQNAVQTQQQTQKKTGRTPGKESTIRSAFEQDIATKGEGANTDAAMGEATFLSRTNEARSRTADALTDTQEKADAQAQRLLQEDYVWNDDDVVIAQKLMFDMVKAIRDYQLKKTSRMKPEAFKRMTEQYNQLMTKHQEKLSKAGQELQANYMFSTGDKIVMKAAQTFLGFTKDGRFAGASVNAKNAKIYAGIEEASKRIQAAVDAEDVQGLAKICKDISNIRNVKKMFGPLGEYASEMESRVLDRIAKGESAAKNLENLAYGNLNAVCDDVQPYKALNAAKTIRVMNMLSNTATIVNNLANNFAQGAVNRSIVNQAFNSLAAKPFAALTGQEVLSQTARGKEARQAVRNAKMEALETATLMQMYGITEENGRLELNDRGLFNPNINPFEQTMSLYKFLTGMGVEATDKMQAAGILKSMELGIDADIKAGKIEAHTKEQRMQEARHEVNRLLYKDDNSTTALVQHVRDYLNKFHVGNDRVGTIGLGDITMAFAKIPANVVRARLAMTPEGALLQVAQYARGVNKAKRMHAEVLAKGIVESHQDQIDAANAALQAAYEMKRGPAKDAAIQKAKSELSRLNSRMWTEAQNACRGSVYRNLSTIAGNYNENMMFNEAVERAGYMNAKEMSQFEAAQLSRKIGRAATSAGMMALGSVLRALGALRDFDQEPDDELRKMNSDKGYRGLMMNLSAIGRKNHEWKDGDLILDGEFLEVIAMPLTIGATAAEAAATAQDAKTWSWLKSMAGNGIAKTFEAVGDIPGMADAINMYESLTSAYNTDYDEKVNRLGAGLLQYAANTVPSFFMPNSISQAAAGFDNKVRDVYTADSAWEQAANIFKNKFPGLRNTIPVSVDVWGNERTYGEGLWGAVNKMLLPGDVQVYRKNKYETEIERMVKAGYGNATPKTTVNSSFEVGDEKYTMTAQEKLDFKAARNTQQRELFEAFMDSDYYKQLNDAERMKVFQSLKTIAERDAKQDMLNGRQLDVEISRDKWETELTDVNDQIQFLAAKQMANNVLDRDAEDMDYAAVDEYLTGAYKALDETQRGLLDSSFSRLDDMFEAKDSYGIGSDMFNTGYDIYKDYMSDEGRARVQGGYKDWEGSQMYTDIAKATGANEKQMDFFEKKFVLYNNNAVVPEKYNEFVDSGWSRDSAQSMVKAVADLTPTNGRKTVSYKQRLTAIATTKGLTEAQRWEAFFEYCPSSYTSVIKSMSRYKSNGFSYEKALKAAKKWDA